MAVVVKVCGCGRSYDAGGWSRLPFDGYQSGSLEGPLRVYEMRRCACGSSLLLEAPIRRPNSVLVVDDDFDLREAVVDILRGEGFEVTEASNGAEALEQISRQKPDVMVLDLMMPVMDGWNVLRTIRQTPGLSTLPIVVLSALSAPGCAEFIQKPVSLDRLLLMLDTIGAKTATAADARPRRFASR